LYQGRPNHPSHTYLATLFLPSPFLSLSLHAPARHHSFAAIGYRSTRHSVSPLLRRCCMHQAHHPLLTNPHITWYHCCLCDVTTRTHARTHTHAHTHAHMHTCTHTHTHTHTHTRYIANIDNWPEFDKMYTQVVGAHRPARAVVPVPLLHYGFELEVEAMAALP
jgi:hypothetical protein